MRVFFSNLGCKLNQAELDLLSRQFRSAGHAVAAELAEADLHVVNTCTVTHVAARDSRKLARRGRRLNPRLKTVLTGCYVTDQPQTAADLAGVDLIVSNQDKDRLLERVDEIFPGLPAAIPVPYVPLELGRSRALVKVEDGCNMRCSFCIIPSTRGSQRSLPPAQVLTQVDELVADGYQEIVITGVQISSYRHGRLRLTGLIDRILAETAVPRLRLTSIAPWDFDPRLLDLACQSHRLEGDGRICRHFHLSLQSGSDATLERMRRPYSRRAFAELVAAVRRRIPEAAITTDVIVGFPGETEEEFEDSLEFLREIGFARIHAFPYSVRPGTAAAELPDRVDPRVQRQRMHRLLELAGTSQQRFRRQRLGEIATVLWETRRGDRLIGTTDHYIRVTCGEATRGIRQLERIRLTAITADGVEAESVAELADPPFTEDDTRISLPL